MGCEGLAGDAGDAGRGPLARHQGCSYRRRAGTFELAGPVPEEVSQLNPYWGDLVNLLRVFRYHKFGEKNPH